MELDLPANRRKVQVWILNPKTLDVLLLKTQVRGELGSFWQPVTGSADPGESLEQAALREATEESSLEFEGGPRSLDYSFEFKAWGARCIETCYWLEYKAGTVKLDPREHQEYRWLSMDHAEAMLKFENNREALCRLKALKES